MDSLKNLAGVGENQNDEKSLEKAAEKVYDKIWPILSDRLCTKFEENAENMSTQITNYIIHQLDEKPDIILPIIKKMLEIMNPLTKNTEEERKSLVDLLEKISNKANEMKNQEEIIKSNAAPTAPEPPKEEEVKPEEAPAATPVMGSLFPGMTVAPTPQGMPAAPTPPVIPTSPFGAMAALKKGGAPTPAPAPAPAPNPFADLANQAKAAAASAASQASAAASKAANQAKEASKPALAAASNAANQAKTAASKAASEAKSVASNAAKPAAAAVTAAASQAKANASNAVAKASVAAKPLVTVASAAAGQAAKNVATAGKNMSGVASAAAGEAAKKANFNVKLATTAAKVGTTALTYAPKTTIAVGSTIAKHAVKNSMPRSLKGGDRVKTYKNRLIRQLYHRGTRRVNLGGPVVP